jgi:hypothetical protein
VREISAESSASSSFGSGFGDADSNAEGGDGRGGEDLTSIWEIKKAISTLNGKTCVRSYSLELSHASSLRAHLSLEYIHEEHRAEY